MKNFIYIKATYQSEKGHRFEQVFSIDITDTNGLNSLDFMLEDEFKPSVLVGKQFISVIELSTVQTA